MKQLILGIDPGSRRTGFGVVAVDGDQVQHVAHGLIQLNEKQLLPERLVKLQAELANVYQQYPVTHTVVEKVFFGKNADSAFVLGHARGVCLLVSAQHGVPVAEYAARFVKKCVTGTGSAAKDHVQLVVSQLLRMTPGRVLALDASDALALALTHARVYDTQARLRRALEDSP